MHVHAQSRRPGADLLGTTGNEAFHFQVNSALRSVTQQHLDTVEIKYEALALSSLLAHNSAAYHSTTSQQKKSDLEHLIVGELIRDFFPHVEISRPALTDRSSQRSRGDGGHRELKLDTRKNKFSVRSEAWDKQKKPDEKKKQKRGVPAGRTSPTRRKRLVRRTVFTKLKKNNANRADDSASRLISWKGLMVQTHFGQSRVSKNKQSPAHIHIGVTTSSVAWMGSKGFELFGVQLGLRRAHALSPSALPRPHAAIHGSSAISFGPR